MQRSLILANRKGGSGKTSSSVNLAACLGSRGKRVLLVDLDPQCHATLTSGLDPYDAAAATLAGRALDAGQPIRCLASPSHGLYDVLPSYHFSAACLCDRLVMLRIGAFLEALAPYDIVLMDTPPARDDVLRLAVTAGTEVAIPLPLQFLALEGFSQIIGLLQLLARQCNPDLRLFGVIPVMTDPRSEHSSRIMMELRETLPEKLLLRRIRMDTAIADAAWKHLPALCLYPESKAVQDYQMLADQVLASPDPRHPFLCASLASLLGIQMEINGEGRDI